VIGGQRIRRLLAGRRILTQVGKPLLRDRISKCSGDRPIELRDDVASSGVCAQVRSWACPGVSIRLKGLPRASTSTWIIEAAAPKDEVEGALALQMACTHIAAMAILARFEGGFSTERRTALFGSAAARLLRTYVAQVEALRRLRTSNRR
jgi:hypothetical protein